MQLKSKTSLFLQPQFIYWSIFALLAILYGPLIIYWCQGWLSKSIGIEHEYFSHGLIGFPFAVYIAWSKRDEWAQLKNKFHPLGGILIGLGAAFYLTGVSDFVNLSFPIVLAGICLWLKGIPGFKLQFFPWLLVLLATPNSVPYLITPYTMPLQKFIAGTAGFFLIQIGIDVTVKEIYLFLGGRLVEVAPYCAGLKMLFTSLYVTLMLVYWTGVIESRKKTIWLLASAVVISVAANIVRNTLLSFLHGTGNEAGFHFIHESWGGDVYSAVMLGLIVLLINLVEKWYPNYDYEEETYDNPTEE